MVKTIHPDLLRKWSVQPISQLAAIGSPEFNSDPYTDESEQYEDNDSQPCRGEVWWCKFPLTKSNDWMVIKDRPVIILGAPEYLRPVERLMPDRPALSPFYVVPVTSVIRAVPNRLSIKLGKRDHDIIGDQLCLVPRQSLIDPDHRVISKIDLDRIEEKMRFCTGLTAAGAFKGGEIHMLDKTSVSLGIHTGKVVVINRNGGRPEARTYIIPLQKIENGMRPTVTIVKTGGQSLAADIDRLDFVPANILGPVVDKVDIGRIQTKLAQRLGL